MSSVFQNTYLSKYNEIKASEKFDQLGVSQRILLTYITTATSTFKWKGVENVPFFMPEQFLLYSGRVGVFLDDGKPVLYPVYPAGKLMPDGEYSQYTAIYPSGKTVLLNRDDVTVIFGNSLKLPSYGMIKDLAIKSSFALSAVDIALKRAMIPPIVAANSEEQLAKILEIQDPEKLLSTICAMMTEDGYGSRDLQRVAVFDNRETDVLALWDVFSRYDRLFYRTFGVSTVGIQKNERLTKAESTGEEEMTRYSLLQDMYNCRIAGIEAANEKFGTQIEIELERDEKTVYETEAENEDKIEIREAAAGTEIMTETQTEKGVEQNELNDDETADQ